MSLDDILARLTELEKATRAAGGTSTEPQHQGVDVAEPVEAAEPSAERQPPQPERIESLPRHQQSESSADVVPVAEKATESLQTHAPAALPFVVDTDVEPAIANSTIVPPPSIPKPPEDTVDGRYGRGVTRSRWPKDREQAATLEAASGHEPRPDPIDIRFNEDESVFVEPVLKQTKQLDFKTLVMATVYFGIVLIAIAIAIYI